MASPKKAADASLQDKQLATGVEQNEQAVAELADLQAERLASDEIDENTLNTDAEERTASTEYEAILRAQLTAKLDDSSGLIRPAVNPALGATQVTIAGRTFGVGPNDAPLGGNPYVTQGEFDLLKQYTDTETDLPLLVDAREVS